MKSTTCESRGLAIRCAVVLSVLQLVCTFDSHAAGCWKNCGDLPCPQVTVGTGIDAALNWPDEPNVIQVTQRCDTPAGVVTSQQWAALLEITIDHATDTDVSRSYYWEQNEPDCVCVRKQHDPANVADTVIHTWGGTVDVRTEGFYTITCTFTNGSPLIDPVSHCATTTGDASVVKGVLVQVVPAPCECDLLADLGGPYDGAFSEIEHGTMYDTLTEGTFHAVPSWELVSQVSGTCGGAVTASTWQTDTITISVSGSLTAELDEYLKGTLGGGLSFSHATNYRITQECMALGGYFRKMRVHQHKLTVDWRYRVGVRPAGTYGAWTWGPEVDKEVIYYLGDPVTTCCRFVTPGGTDCE